MEYETAGLREAVGTHTIEDIRMINSKGNETVMQQTDRNGPQLQGRVLGRKLARELSEEEQRVVSGGAKNFETDLSQYKGGGDAGGGD